MTNDDSSPPAEPVDLRELSAEDAPTINQLVAYNMTRARRSRGWTQQEVADRLERYTGRVWSKASISAAERSWQGGRPRRFDANELVALAVIFETPVAYFLLPMEEGVRAVVMAQPEDRKPNGFHWIGVGLHLRRALLGDLKSVGGMEFLVRAKESVRKYQDSVWSPPSFLDRETVDREAARAQYQDEEDVDWSEVVRSNEDAAAGEAESLLTAKQQQALLKRYATKIAHEIVRIASDEGVKFIPPEENAQPDEWGGDHDQPPPF
jgi:transcriptional regulator with XRE-family HTH domain